MDSRFRLRLQDRELAFPESGELVVGRDPECDVPLDDRLVSRRHATFRRTPDQLTVIDHGSVNGVRVNDVPVDSQQQLLHRDRVQIGAHVFVVLEVRGGRRKVHSTPTMKGVGRVNTRPIEAAGRPVTTLLDAIARSLEQDDIPGAALAMDAVVARYADATEAVAPSELTRVTNILLVLAAYTGQARFFDRIFHIHTARQIVPDSASLDSIQESLPKIPGATAAAVLTHLDAMHARSAALSAQEQVRLRRVASIAERLGKGSS
jgi:hypothetical protein